MQQMMAVLPYGLRHDQGYIGRQLAKNLQPHLLRIYEAMLFGGIVRMRPDNFPTLSLKRLGKLRLHLRLLGPAPLIGGQAQVAISHEISLLCLQRCCYWLILLNRRTGFRTRNGCLADSYYSGTSSV